MMTLKRRDWSSRFRIYSTLLLCCLVAILWTCGPSLSRAWAQAEAPAEVPAPLSSDDLNQLVAPIALYPDALVAQVLAGSTYPTEVVEAARWQSANAGLSGTDLAAAVDSQPWDPSIKALTQFPSVLANMNTNLSWTSALGQAYYYQPEDVLNAVQVMRQRALAARTLTDTAQQNVVDQGNAIMIVPSNPNEVYVPAYNPGVVYGAPEAVYPGYSTGDLIGTGLLAFGAGVAVGMLANQSWGWHGWNTDWHQHHVIYQNSPYISTSNTFYGGGGRGGGGNNGGNFNRQVGNNRQGGFNASGAGGRPQGGMGGGRGAGPNPQANPNRETANRGPREQTAPGAAVRPESGAKPDHRPNMPASAPANVNHQVANRGPREQTAPAAGVHPEAGPKPAYRPNVTAPQAVRNNPRPPARQANPYRGFAKAPAPGVNKTAFSGIAPGGQAMAASARGRASLSRAPAPPRAAPAAHAAAPPAAARPAPHAAPPAKAAPHKR
jgi:hypothetical protein